MPRQKKHASYPDHSGSSAEKSKKLAWRRSRSLGCCCSMELRPITSTEMTSGSSRHSRSTPCPTMPVAPKTMTFMTCGSGNRGGGETAYRSGGIVPEMTILSRAAVEGGKDTACSKGMELAREPCVPNTLGPHPPATWADE